MTSSVPPAGSPEPRPQDDAEFREWNRVRGMVNAECPDCGFCFWEDHRDEADNFLSCPACAERKLLALVSQRDAEIAALREDKERLDWLDRTDEVFNTTAGWFARPTKNYYATVRQAIDAARRPLEEPRRE